MNELVYKERVFKALCDDSQNWYGASIFSSREIAERTGLSRYKVIKAMHALADEGLVEKDCEGCPAVVSCGEYGEELESEAAPPINGWSVTKKGRETETYTLARKEYMQGLADWANEKGDYADEQLCE